MPDNSFYFHISFHAYLSPCFVSLTPLTCAAASRGELRGAAVLAHVPQAVQLAGICSKRRQRPRLLQDVTRIWLTRVVETSVVRLESSRPSCLRACAGVCRQMRAAAAPSAGVRINPPLGGTTGKSRSARHRRQPAAQVSGICRSAASDRPSTDTTGFDRKSLGAAFKGSSHAPEPSTVMRHCCSDVAFRIVWLHCPFADTNA